jgi:DNA-binding NarL/FixJ family response regulator
MSFSFRGKMKAAAVRKKYRIALVDDHPIVLEGLVQLFSGTKDLQVCGQAREAAEAAQMVGANSPDLVVVDLFLRGNIAIDLIRELRQENPELAILVFTVKKEAFLAERAFRAGVDGYVVKEDASAELLHAVRLLLKGGVYVSKKTRDEMLHDPEVRKSQGIHSLIRKLSDREMQVFNLLGEGSNLQQIADEVGAGLKTVETYCSRIKKKLRLRDGHDLLRLAIQWHPEARD